jgi:inner membrane protein
MGWIANISETQWFVLGLVLLIAELASGTTYLLWPAVAAGITGFATLALGLDLLTETALFAVLTLVLTLLGRPLARNLRAQTASGAPLNERAAGLVGARVIAQKAFGEAEIGEVRVADSNWRATSADRIAEGQTVEIVAVDGVTLRVKAV